MRSHEDILDYLGEYLVKEIYDSPVDMMNFYLKEELEKHEQNEIFIDFFQSLNSKQKELFVTVNKDLMSNVMFQFFLFFDSNPEYKIIFEEDGKVSDIKELVPYLPSLAAHEGGWIDRFSKFSDKKDQEV